ERGDLDAMIASFKLRPHRAPARRVPSDGTSRATLPGDAAGTLPPAGGSLNRTLRSPRAKEQYARYCSGPARSSGTPLGGMSMTFDASRTSTEELKRHAPAPADRRRADLRCTRIPRAQGGRRAGRVGAQDALKR